MRRPRWACRRSRRGRPCRTTRATARRPRRRSRSSAGIEELLDAPIEHGELDEDARAWERGIDELAASDTEVAEYVECLEEAQDTADLPEASGDAIAKEFERYLRRRSTDEPYLRSAEGPTAPRRTTVDRWTGRAPRTGSTATSPRGGPTTATRSRPCSAADVAYRYHPYDEPIVGREAVVASWLGEGGSDDASTRDAPGTYEAAYSPIAIDGDTVVATGPSQYREVPDGPVVRTYENCFVMRFDDAGRCRDFTEYYLKRP